LTWELTEKTLGIFYQYPAENILSYFESPGVDVDLPLKSVTQTNFGGNY
jgi:hypothetical protein